MVHITFCSHSQPPYAGLVIRPVRMVMQHGPPAMEKGMQVCVHRYFPFSSTEFPPYLWLFSKVTESPTNFFFFFFCLLSSDLL